MSTTGNAHLSREQDQPSQLSKYVMESVKRYCQLASKPYLTEAEEQEFDQLLRLAETNAELDFWFNEADHFLAHELCLTDSTSIGEVERKQIRLQMCLKSALADSSMYMPIEEVVFAVEDEDLEKFEIYDNDLESIDALLKYTHSIYCQVQTQLKSHGYDPGPEDGVLGKRTRSAIQAFQRAKCLIPNGNADPITKKALGIRC